MAKDCVFRITQDDKTCQKNQCEQYFKYMIGTKVDEVEVKECVLLTLAKLWLPRSGARVSE